MCAMSLGALWGHKPSKAGSLCWQAPNGLGGGGGLVFNQNCVKSLFRSKKKLLIKEIERTTYDTFRVRTSKNDNGPINRDRHSARTTCHL